MRAGGISNAYSIFKIGPAPSFATLFWRLCKQKWFFLNFLAYRAELLKALLHHFVGLCRYNGCYRILNKKDKKLRLKTMLEENSDRMLGNGSCGGIGISSDLHSPRRELALFGYLCEFESATKISWPVLWIRIRRYWIRIQELCGTGSVFGIPITDPDPHM